MWEIFTVFDVTVVCFFKAPSCGDMEEPETTLNSQANQLTKDIDEVRSHDVKSIFFDLLGHSQSSPDLAIIHSV